jgi:hypothetical protein
MTIVLNRPLNYLLFFIISCYLFLFTIADNDTDYHSNETIVEFNSTFLSLTTIANISDEDIVTDDNKNVSFSTIFIDSTAFSTSGSLETTDVSVLEANTTLNEDNDLTTIVTEVYTEKNDEQTTIVSNTSCELSKYGCCSDGITERNGKNF